MYKKMVLLISISLFIICIIGGAWFLTNHDNLNEPNIVRIAIYPIGSMSGTYYIQLNIDNGSLSVEQGTRRMSQIDFSVVENIMIRKPGVDYEKTTAELSPDEVGSIIDQLSEIYANDSLIYTGRVADSWAITIKYNDKFFENNRFTNYPELVELATTLLDKADIKAEFHGFS